MKGLSDVFKEYRKRNNITQKEMALLLECSLPVISKIETNTYSAGKKILNNFLALNDVSKEEKQFLLDYRKNRKKTGKKNNSQKIKVETESEYSFEEMVRIRAVLSEYDTTNRLVKLIWDFREMLFNNFQEIDLLLSTNEHTTNKKMEKGILKMSEDLEELSKKMKRHIVKEIKEVQIL